jgi:LysM repeat protein
MIGREMGMVIAATLLAGATSAWSQQYYLYAPTPITAEEKIQNKEGLLVQEVPVKKGDTLSGISRAFSGRGSYYPQILLFNDIKDPNRIYPGNVIRVPLPRVGVAVQGVPPLKKADNTGEKKRNARNKAAVTAAGQKQPASPGAAKHEKRLYRRAVKAYRHKDYRAALDLFDRFLAEHASSDMAADASLYKAECYLKLSSQ